MAQQIVLEESIDAVRLGRANGGTGLMIICARKSQAGRYSHWWRNLCALRGLDMIAGAGLAAAIGDPSSLMAASNFMRPILVWCHPSIPLGTQRHTRRHHQNG